MASGSRKTSKTNNTQKKPNTGKKSKSKKVVEEDYGELPVFTQDLILFAVLAVMVLLFLGNLGFGGLVGSYISGFLFGLFGTMNYFLPILLGLGSFFWFSNRHNAFAKRKLIYAGIFYVFFAVLIELFMHKSDYVGPVKGYFLSMESHLGGGFFGALFAEIFVTAFGMAFGVILDIIILIVMLILITEKSGIEKFLEKRKIYKAKKAAREERRQQELDEAPLEIIDASSDVRMRRRTGNYEREPQSNIHNGRRVRQVREQVLNTDPNADRSERRASGVTLNTKIEPRVNDINHMSDEISEITAQSLMHMQDQPVSDVDVIDLKAEEYQKEATPVSPFDPFHHEAAAIPAEEVLTPQMNEAAPVTEEEPPVLEPQIITEVRVHDVTSDNPFPNAFSSNQTVTPNSADTEKAPVHHEYVFPPVDLLRKGKNSSGSGSSIYRQTAERLKNTLNNFGISIDGDISYVNGPTVTRYEFKPSVGVKVSRIVNLTDDIKMNLAATDIRIEAPVPGRDVVGIEVPNKETEMVAFRDLVESNEFRTAKSRIAFAVGKDIGGQVIISDIAKMPHLLIAGATGSGKSVCINTIIMSILYHAKPEEVKFIMIDPKVVELSVYNGIPHLLVPVVTDPKRASAALQWAVAEMTDRYKKFADTGVRDMKGYNDKIHDGKMKIMNNGEEIEIAVKKMPQLVVIVDELADLMMVSSNEVEEAICRLAQLARAAGIHLVIATQRPSVNVITGLIKANMPSRIAFSVTSGVDSRTILDMVGAEKLLGKGDMLYYPQGLSKPIRVQGAFCSDDEVSDVVNFIKKHNSVDADEEQLEIQQKMEEAESQEGYTSIDGGGSGFSDGRDEYFAEAARLIIDKEKGSIGMLQRNFKIGFNRAARIMDQLEEFGVVGPEEGTKPRRVLMSPQDLEDMLNKKE